MSTKVASVPLRVGLCITELNVGGAERCLVELATRLDRARFVPRVYCLGSPPGGNAALLVDRLARAGVPVRFFGGRGWLDAPRVLRQLRRQFRADRLDLLQTFLFHANVLGTFAAWRADVPRIVTGLRVAEPNRRWRRPIERLAGRWVDKHVAVSEGVARFAHEKVGFPTEKLVVIANGVNLESETIRSAFSQSIAPANLGLAGNRRALAFVGRLDRQKGIDGLIECAPRLLNELPSHDLLIVGAGPLAGSLRSRAEQLKIADRVHFLGWRDDVPAIAAAADLLLVPSLWEGMSNVVLETMALGRAIVAFDVEGVAEAIGDNASPQIVPFADWNQFVERITVLARDQTLRESEGAANRRRIEAQFSIVRMIREYEDLFLALCRPISRS